MVMESGSGPLQQSRYLMFSENNYSLRPPPQRRNIPQYHSNSKSSGGKRWFKCMCCTCFFLFIILFILSAFLLFIYFFFQPQTPSYKLNNFNVQAFTVRPDLTLYTEFIVSVKADNPNQDIGFTYGKDSSVIVLYSGSILCSGKLPNFHQPEKNVTMIDIDLKGESEFGSGLHQALMENKKRGKIPLLVVVKVPVVTVFGNFSLKQVFVHVNCSLVVDNLTPREKVSILSSNYSYDISL